MEDGKKGRTVERGGSPGVRHFAARARSGARARMKRGRQSRAVFKRFLAALGMTGRSSTWRAR